MTPFEFSKLVQDAANDEDYVNESELERAACRAIERVFARVERKLAELASTQATT